MQSHNKIKLLLILPLLLLGGCGLLNEIRDFQDFKNSLKNDLVAHCNEKKGELSILDNETKCTTQTEGGGSIIEIIK